MTEKSTENETKRKQEIHYTNNEWDCENPSTNDAGGIQDALFMIAERLETHNELLLRLVELLELATTTTKAKL